MFPQFAGQNAGDFFEAGYQEAPVHAWRACLPAKARPQPATVDFGVALSVPGAIRTTVSNPTCFESRRKRGVLW